MYQVERHETEILQGIFSSLYGASPSREAWKDLTLRVQQAQERTPPRLTQKQVLDLYRAFRALLPLIAEGSGHMSGGYYAGNLGLVINRQQEKDLRGRLVKVVDQEIALIRKHPGRGQSGFIGRCVAVAIRDEPIEPQALNAALRPYFGSMWEIVARKHWDDLKKPLIVPVDHVWRPSLNPTHNNALVDKSLNIKVHTQVLDDTPDFRITVELFRGNGLALSFSVSNYALVNELVRAFENGIEVEKHLGSSGLKSAWDGPAFNVYAIAQSGGNHVALSIKDGEVYLAFTRAEWYAIYDLLKQSLAQADVPARCDALKLRYGFGF
jgi:hypothetical protein